MVEPPDVVAQRGEAPEGPRVADRPREDLAASGAPRPPGWRSLRFPVAVFALGLIVTAALTVPAEVSYRHNERRLLNLQTNLTGTVLATAPRQTEATLGRVVGLVAASQDPVATFKGAIAPSMAPKGPYASSTLVLLKDDGEASVLDHEGGPQIRSATDPASIALYKQVAATKSLVTAHAAGGGIQKIGYLLSAKGTAGTFVVAVAQQLPVPDRITIPKGSPDSNLDLALYFGTSTAPANLIVTTRSPPHGTTSKTTVPFGNNSLTVVASARASLAGAWAEFLPWGIVVVGVGLSLLSAFEAGRLARRRRVAELSARANRALYQYQRAASETLQRSLLPRTLPSIAGVDIAARYVPGTGQAEIGGDWYSVIAVDEDRFVFVVGDVSGHGVQAAGTMALLRSTTRTLAKLRFPPDEILRRANDELNLVEDGQFATVLVGSVSVATQELVVASAGHPPPYLVRDGRGAFVTLTTGTPLGIPPARLLPTTVAFPPGSTLVAFTDGLIERRDESIDAGMRRLASIASSGGPSAEAMVTRVLGSVTTDGHDDDIALLVIRLLAGDEPGPVGEAVPGSLTAT